MVTAGHILKLVDSIAPFDLAESWDNSGFQAGNPEWEVKRIMVSLDASSKVMNAARKWNADMVLTHHPLIMVPVKKIDFSHMPGAAIAVSSRNRINIVSAHTNFDKARDGLNDYFAQIIGIEDKKPFYDEPEKGSESLTGLGRIGKIKTPLSFRDLVRDVKKILKLEYLRITGDMNLFVETVAVCTGSGGSLISKFLESDADVYITGDIKYHESRLIEEHNRGLIDVGHFASEHIAVYLLCRRLKKAVLSAGLNIEIKGFKEEKDPFTIV